MKYNVGDKVRIKSLDWYNENKTIHGDIWLNNAVFVGGQSLYCGCELTIRLVTDDSYYVIENDYYWTDEMIEGLAEDETKPIFKVGDKITNGKDKLLILNIVSDKYIVEDNFGECGTVYFNTQDYWKLVEDDVIDIDEFQDDNEIIDIIDEYVHRIKNNECQIDLPEGYQFTDEYGNVINATKIILEKKPKYPKTYVECSDILSVYTDPNICGYKGELLWTFQKLLICRDAYWKIVGKEMGLGEPWKPDWNNQELPKYCIANIEGQIKTAERFIINTIFAFPTAEIRNAFRENFDPDIEKCKEFL